MSSARAYRLKCVNNNTGALPVNKPHFKFNQKTKVVFPGSWSRLLLVAQCTIIKI